MKIKHWTGRLGNTIQQLTNALYYCERNELNFESPSFGYVDGKSLAGVRLNGEAEIIKPISITDRNSCDKQGLFYFHTNRRRDHHVDDQHRLEQNRRRFCEEYILPNSCFNTSIKPLSEDHLVIHIRTGDIMNKNNPEKKGSIYHSYLTNPIEFYNQIIPKFSKVTIVTRTSDNFIINHLTELYKHIHVQSSDIKSDFTTLLAAKHLASSGVGTFPIGAALMSNNLCTYYHTNLHLPEHMSHDSLNHIKKVSAHVPDTYLEHGWRNCEQDRREILEFKDITLDTF